MALPSPPPPSPSPQVFRCLHQTYTPAVLTGTEDKGEGVALPPPPPPSSPPHTRRCLLVLKTGVRVWCCHFPPPPLFLLSSPPPLPKCSDVYIRHTHQTELAGTEDRGEGVVLHLPPPSIPLYPPPPPFPSVPLSTAGTHTRRSLLALKTGVRVWRCHLPSPLTPSTHTRRSLLVLKTGVRVWCCISPPSPSTPPPPPSQVFRCLQQAHTPGGACWY